MAKTIGFIGLGGMGVSLCRNFIEAGYDVVVWNRTASKVGEFVQSLPEDQKKRVVHAESPAEAAKTGIVFSIVANDAALRDIIQGNNGVISGLPNQGIHVCISTVSPSLSDEMQDVHSKNGSVYVACPVFGRPDAVAAKRHTFVPAGPHEAVDCIMPMLQSTSRKVVRAGAKPSYANVLKLCGNFTILASMEMMAESFTLAESAGIPRQVAYDLIAGPDGILSSLPIFQGYGHMIANADFEPVGFTAVNGLKDAALVCDTAANGQVDMPIATLMKGRLQQLVNEGGGQREWAAFSEQIKVGTLNPSTTQE